MSDMKFNPATCFKPTDIVRYLDAGEIKDDTLHHELIASLVVQGIHSLTMNWKNIYIYFIPKDSRQKELIEAIGSTIARNDVPDFFKKNIEENSEFDVIILDRSDPKMAAYRPIQLKRFGIRMNPDHITDNFIAFIDEKIQQYAKNKGSMYVFLENKGTLDFATIKQHLKTVKFPFEELSVFAFNSQGNVIVCQLLPLQDEVTCLEIERQILFPKS